MRHRENELRALAMVHDEDAGVWRIHARFARDAGADDAADARRMARAHRTAARLLRAEAKRVETAAKRGRK